MHYVRTWSHKYFFQLFWFSVILTQMYDSEMWCRGRMGQGALLHRSHSILMIFNAISWHYLSPQIFIFQELLIIEIQNLCTCMPWTLNMLHSSHFNDAFSPVKINKMWNFCLKFWFFRNSLIVETWNLHHWIQHALNLNYATQTISMYFSPVKINKIVKFLAVCWNQKKKK